MADRAEVANRLYDELLNTVDETKRISKENRGVEALSVEEMETLTRAFAHVAEYFHHKK